LRTRPLGHEKGKGKKNPKKKKDAAPRGRDTWGKGYTLLRKLASSIGKKGSLSRVKKINWGKEVLKGERNTGRRTEDKPVLGTVIRTRPGVSLKRGPLEKGKRIRRGQARGREKEKGYVPGGQLRVSFEEDCRKDHRLGGKKKKKRGRKSLRLGLTTIQ